MKILVIGDLHLDSKIGSKKVYDFFEVVKDKIIKLSVKCDITIILGDIFKDPYPNNYDRKLFSLFLKELKNAYIILGNHDIDINGHSLQQIEPITKDVIIVDNMINVNDITLIAYNRDIEKIKTNLIEAKTKYIFGHFDIGNYSINNHTIESKISNIVNKDCKVYLGHIHKRQKVNNITYVGSVAPTNLSELGYEFGVLVLDNGNEEFINFNYEIKKIVLNSPEEIDKNDINSNTYLIINLKDLKEKHVYMNKIKEYLGIEFVIEGQKIEKKEIDFNMDFKNIVYEYLKIIKKEYLKEKIYKYIEEEV